MHYWTSRNILWSTTVARKREIEVGPDVSPLPAPAAACMYVREHGRQIVTYLSCRDPTGEGLTVTTRKPCASSAADGILAVAAVASEKRGGHRDTTSREQLRRKQGISWPSIVCFVQNKRTRFVFGAQYICFPLFEFLERCTPYWVVAQ